MLFLSIQHNGPTLSRRGKGGLSAPADQSASALLTGYGLRVPTFVVSPWTPAGKGPDIVLDHCSILKTILARFCGDTRPFLSDRVDASLTFDAYLSAPAPRLDVPPPPPLAALPAETSATGIDTGPVSREQLSRDDVEFDDLTGLFARVLLGRDTSDSPLQATSPFLDHAHPGSCRHGDVEDRRDHRTA
jgi:hypothetical protein